ncbi:MAG: class I SAM-dependent methyltransferase [Acidobacteria bacterium]|nr:class I SAM-dependent methyltransferase [Acidobacteriota bacterium]
MSQTPSPLVSQWLPILRVRLGARRDALDLAMGAGRHARAAAEHGFRVFGVDRDLDRVRLARTGALEHARLWVADLDTVTLPRDRFDLVICTNYLQRSIWPALRESVRAGGFVIYETFTVAQLAHSTGPRSPDHLLRPGELRAAFDGWEVCHNEECTVQAGVARLVARKRATRSGD